jgi:hypothetical protein
MTPDQIKALSLPERDRLAAVEVMGWHVVGEGYRENGAPVFFATSNRPLTYDDCEQCEVWHPSENLAQAAMVRERAGVTEAGASAYITELCRIVGAGAMPLMIDGIMYAPAWVIKTATPEQDTLAALIAWAELKGGE